ncbi:hypothetical protein AB0E08_49460, partial [Streptomyces sp. NPDC048281]
MTEEIESADKVGSVSVSRYAEIVAELRKLVETACPRTLRCGQARTFECGQWSGHVGVPFDGLE